MWWWRCRDFLWRLRRHNAIFTSGQWIPLIFLYSSFRLPLRARPICSPSTSRIVIAARKMNPSQVAPLSENGPRYVCRSRTALSKSSIFVNQSRSTNILRIALRCRDSHELWPNTRWGSRCCRRRTLRVTCKYKVLIQHKAVDPFVKSQLAHSYLSMSLPGSSEAPEKKGFKVLIIGAGIVG